MQDRYVGDVGDFAKYALLRRLAGTSVERPIRLGVVWCLYPDEKHNSDGKHIGYLRRPEFSDLDDELLAALRLIVESGRRSISAVSTAKILPRRTIFCPGLASLPELASSNRERRLIHRHRWLETCFQLTASSELVFFDPDNGIEVASIPKHHRSAGKYIYWDELVPFWTRGQALLIYHHLNRTKPARAQVAQLRAHLHSRLAGAAVKPLIFRRGSCRVFWLVCPHTVSGNEIDRRASTFLHGGWATHFESIN
jgi:hypothetical protein